jgi:hypothetical protein
MERTRCYGSMGALETGMRWGIVTHPSSCVSLPSGNNRVFQLSVVALQPKARKKDVNL